MNDGCFDFEIDFFEDKLRCIPMIVRLKLDTCGVKLKLSEWSKLTTCERLNLARWPIDAQQQLTEFRTYLTKIIVSKTGHKPQDLIVYETPWLTTDEIPDLIQTKLKEYNLQISLDQWQGLTELQRFALTKLSRPGHENRNFPKAIKEFNLLPPL